MPFNGSNLSRAGSTRHHHLLANDGRHSTSPTSGRNRFFRLCGIVAFAVDGRYFAAHGTQVTR